VSEYQYRWQISTQPKEGSNTNVPWAVTCWWRFKCCNQVDLLPASADLLTNSYFLSSDVSNLISIREAALLANLDRNHPEVRFNIRSRPSTAGARRPVPCPLSGVNRTFGVGDSMSAKTQSDMNGSGLLPCKPILIPIPLLAKPCCNCHRKSAQF